MTQEPYFSLLRLTGVKALVVGGGQVALRKIESLLKSGAQVQVVSPRVVPQIRTLANEARIQLWLIYFNPKVFDGHSLVFACTDNPEVNRQVAEAAKAAGAWVNVADQSAASSLIIPSSVNHEGILLGVSTGLPALSAKIRRELEAELSFGYDRLLEFLQQARERLKEEIPDQKKRSEVLTRFLEGVHTRDLIKLDDQALQERFTQCLSSFME